MSTELLWNESRSPKILKTGNHASINMESTGMDKVSLLLGLKTRHSIVKLSLELIYKNESMN